MSKKVSKEEIDALRSAIKKDEKQAYLAEQNAGALKLLQEKEVVLKEQLKDTQKEIVDRATKKFDVSDPMAIEVAKETLQVLEKKYASAK